MTLYVDARAGFFGGTAKAGDIKRLGLIRASAKERGLPVNNPQDLTRWSVLFADTDENGDLQPEPEPPKPDEDDEW